MQWVLLLVSLTILLQIPATASVFTLDQFTSVKAAITLKFNKFLHMFG